MYTFTIIYLCLIKSTFFNIFIKKSSTNLLSTTNCSRTKYRKKIGLIQNTFRSFVPGDNKFYERDNKVGHLLHARTGLSLATELLV